MPYISKYKIAGSGGASGTMDITPIKIGIGRRNIKKVDLSIEANLGRQLQAAFGEIQSNFEWYTNQLVGFLPEDMTAALEPTLELAIEYCPVDTGALVESAYLETEQYRGGARAEIGFAKGGIPDYAVIVHEVPRNHAPPTRDKFLQAAIDETYYAILQRVTDRVKARSGTS